MRTMQTEGTFRGKATGWQVKQIPSGQVAITVMFEVDKQRVGDEVKSCAPAFVKGDFFVTKKTGSPNDAIAEMLCRCLGWGGTFAEITETPPLDAEVEIDVEAKQWKDRTFYEARWIRMPGEAAKAGGPAPLGYGEAKALDKKMGAGFADIAKKAKSDATKRVERTTEDYGDIPF